MPRRAYTVEEQHERMLQMPMPRLVAELSVPTVFSQIVTVIYNTADTWFVSQISTAASGAVGIAFSLMSIIQALGFGIGMGASSLISLRLGEKQQEEAEKVAASACVAAFFMGLLVLILGLFTLRPLMVLLGSTKTILPYSCDYARYILLAAPLMCLAFVLSSILRSEGSAAMAAWGLCLGGILNVILDPLFIFTFRLGIAGAAMATAVGQGVSCMVLLIPFLRRKSIVRLRPRRISRRWETYREIVLTGSPTIFRQGMAGLASALLNNRAALYGDAAVAAVNIGVKVYLLIRNIILGVGQGFQPIAGYNFGAGNKKRTRSAFWIACLYGTVICVTAAGLIALFAPEIVGWFRQDPAVIAIGTRVLYFGCAVMPFMAYSTYVNQLYQCLGFRVPATVLACCRQGIFFVPAIFLLPAFWGLLGVEMTQAAADLATFFVSVPFQIYFSKKHLSS